MPEIVKTDGVIGGEPRIDGTRIGVREVYALSVEGGYPPIDVADQLDISVGAVHTALAYYYEHPEEMRALERDRRESEKKPRQAIGYASSISRVTGTAYVLISH